MKTSLMVATCHLGLAAAIAAVVVARTPPYAMSLSSCLLAGGVVLVDHAVELLYFFGVVLVMRSERESICNKRPKKGALQKYCC